MNSSKCKVFGWGLEMSLHPIKRLPNNNSLKYFSIISKAWLTYLSQITFIVHIHTLGKRNKQKISLSSKFITNKSLKKWEKEKNTIWCVCDHVE